MECQNAKAVKVRGDIHDVAGNALHDSIDDSVSYLIDFRSLHMVALPQVLGNSGSTAHTGQRRMDAHLCAGAWEQHSVCQNILG